MKKFINIFLISLFLLAGCEGKKVNENLEDPNYNSEAKYNVLFNEQLKFVDETENGTIILYPAVGELGSGFLPTFVENDSLTLITSDASSTCTINDASGCEGLIYQNHTPTYYYKGNLYFLANEIDNTTNNMHAYVKRSDLDGMNVVTIFDVGTNETLMGSWYMDSLQFHNNKMYLITKDEFYIGDLKTEKINKIEIAGLNSIYRNFLVKDKMYIAADQYDDGSKVYFDVLLQCDLEGNIEKVLYDGIRVFMVDDTNIIYMKNENSMFSFYMMNRETEKTMELLEATEITVLKKDEFYLFDYSVDNNTFIEIYDTNGKLVYQKDYSNEGYHLLQGYIGDRIYVLKDDQYGYYEVTKEGITNLNVIELASE